MPTRAPTRLPTRALLLALLLVLTSGLAACSLTPTACAAVLVSNTVHVHLTGHSGAVADVTYCGGRGCTPRRQGVVDGGGTPTPVPAYHSGDDWTIPASTARPRHGRVAALRDDDSTLTSRAVDLTWVNAGTLQCPGPYDAHLSLRLPS